MENKIKNGAALLFLFVMAFLFSCAQSTNNASTPNEVTEDKKDSVKASIDPGSRQVAYVKEDQLFLYDLKAKQGKRIPLKEAVFSIAFAEDGKSIYYTAVNGTSVGLYKCIFMGTVTTEYIGKFSEKKDFFLSQTYSEKGRLLILQDTLYAEGNFVWDDFSFHSCYKVNLKTKEISLKDNDLYKITERTLREREKSMAPLRSRIRNAFVLTKTKKKIQEIFLFKGKDSLRLTNTASYVDLDGAEEFDLYKSYELSPDFSKLFFYFQTVMGDLGHGPCFVVNLDGSGQTLLTADLLGADHTRPVWFERNKLLFLNAGESNSYNKADLNLIETEDNSILTIDKDVSFFAIQP
jgi:hypothetical protein